MNAVDRIRSSGDIAQRIAAVVECTDSPPQLGHVLGRVEELMGAWPNQRGIYQELQRLADFIQDTKTEIAALRPDEVKQQYLPTAADELDAIVAATAQATNTIMDSVEAISSAASTLGKDENDRVMNAVTRIYEACTFQDITGQRITKVVKVLKVIEDRIDKLLIAVGGAESFLPPAAAAGMPAAAQASIDEFFAAAEVGATPDEALLNGPALPGSASTQDEIDALLATFD